MKQFLEEDAPVNRNVFSQPEPKQEVQEGAFNIFNQEPVKKEPEEDNDSEDFDIKPMFY